MARKRQAGRDHRRRPDRAGDGADRAPRRPRRRDRQQPRAAVADLGGRGARDGVSAGTVEDAAAADIVVLAVLWADVPKPSRGSNGRVRS